RLESAKASLDAANEQLAKSKLTDEEQGAAARLLEAETSVDAVERQTKENDEKFNFIKGRLAGLEGLHGRRAALAARVDVLERLVERETLERDAVDRLYELFEESRDRRLGTLIEPVHDRVLGWMRVLGVDGYREVKFGDSFLPDKLVRSDEAEF